MPVKIHLCTVVWGPWHTGQFLDVGLPSLLSQGNLPALSKAHDVIYRIFTSEADVPQIRSSSAYRLLRRIVRCDLIKCFIDPSIHPIAMHHMLWQRAKEEARERHAMISFILPDAVWSDGAFSHIAKLLDSGKRAIFMTHMRVVQETFVPELKRRYQRAKTTPIHVSPQALVRLSLKHLHPLSLTYERKSTNFPVHPEFILWSVPGEGFLMRYLVREVFTYDPGLFGINHQALIAHKAAPELIHHITDSNDLYSLSLTPHLKDLDWYARPQTEHDLQIAEWWLKYDSPVNDLLTREYFYVHFGERTPVKWRAAELASDAFMRRVAGAREVLRVVIGLNEPKFLAVRQLLSLALSETKLASALPRLDKVTLLLPSDQALAEWTFRNGEEMLQRRSSRRLVNLLLGHVVEGELRVTPGHTGFARNLLGQELRWWYPASSGPVIAGAKILDRELSIGGHKALYIDDVLEIPDRASNVRRQRVPRAPEQKPPATPQLALAIDSITESGRRLAQGAAGIENISALYARHAEIFGLQPKRLMQFVIDGLRDKAGWSAALNALALAVKLDPDNVSASENLALVLEQLGRWDEVLKVRESIASRHPGSHANDVAVGRILERTQNWKTAAEHYSRTVGSKPWVLFGRCRDVALSGSTKADLPTIAHLKHSVDAGLELAPDDIMLHLAEGFMHIAEGNLLSARQSFLTASLSVDRRESLRSDPAQSDLLEMEWQVDPEFDPWALAFAEAFLLDVQPADWSGVPLLASVDRNKLRFVRGALLRSQGAVYPALEEFGIAISTRALEEMARQPRPRFFLRYKDYRIIAYQSRFYAIPRAVVDFSFHNGALIPIPRRPKQVRSRLSSGFNSRWLRYGAPVWGWVRYMSSVCAALARPIGSCLLRIPTIAPAACKLAEVGIHIYVRAFAVRGTIVDIDALALRRRIDATTSRRAARL